MRNLFVKKLALAGMLCAVAVVGSLFQFPVFGSQCAPVQHMVNVISAVFLGPWWGVAMAFPGSMCGALLCGLVYWKSRNLPATLCAEVIGTGVIGGLAAYPVAKLVMGLTPETYTVYIVPFLISTVAGSVLAGILVTALKKSGAFRSMDAKLEH